MFSAFQTFGKLGALASSVARAWSPLALWPDGIATPGMWISPRTLDSQWQDYTGTTPVATPGTVADSSNPVGLALDIRAGATVLTDPGNHMLQSTSAARPLLSARVNALKYTEDFADAYWFKDNVTLSSVAGIAPDGGAATLVTAATGAYWRIGTNGVGSAINSINVANHYYVKKNVGDVISGGIDGNTTFDYTFSTALASNLGSSVVSVTPELLADGWVHLVVVINSPAWTPTPLRLNNLSDSAYLWHPQINLGSTALPYQRVGAVSDYDSTGFPIAQLYDGVDDSMATAAFAAGTLINGMDCMIAVRRDSAAETVIGLCAALRYFGAADALANPAVFNSGSPTVWVDGTQLSGGTSVLSSTLGTALTVGTWHIVEFRGLDLSLWTQAIYSGFVGSYSVNGPRGDILLYPSTASTEDKDAARQWLADYYGVTLP